MSQMRDLLSRTLRHVTNRKSVALPTKVWATKGFEFWTFLSLLLLKSNCSRILELGTGRSSITLAEYAKFRNAHLTCVETDEPWFNKLRLDLHHLKLPTTALQLIPLDRSTGWYDLEQFRSATGTTSFDFLFVDGPNAPAGNSRGIRNSQHAINEIRTCGRNAEVIIVDDVHRRHILDTLDRFLIDPSRYDKWFYHYSVKQHAKGNTLCAIVKRGSEASRELSAIKNFTGVTLHPTFDPKSCHED